MVTNKIPENGIPEPLDSNESGNDLGKAKIEDENLLKKKLKIEEISASMRDQIKEELLHPEDSFETSLAPKVTTNTPPSPHDTVDKKKFSAFDPIPTRHYTDKGKGAARAVLDSVIVFGGLILDVGKDTVAVIRHPIDRTKGTLVYLEEVNPGLHNI